MELACGRLHSPAVEVHRLPIARLGRCAPCQGVNCYDAVVVSRLSRFQTQCPGHSFGGRGRQQRVEDGEHSQNDGNPHGRADGATAIQTLACLVLGASDGRCTNALEWLGQGDVAARGRRTSSGGSCLLLDLRRSLGLVETPFLPRLTGSGGFRRHVIWCGFLGVNAGVKRLLRRLVVFVHLGHDLRKRADESLRSSSRP